MKRIFSAKSTYFVLSILISLSAHAAQNQNKSSAQTPNRAVTVLPGANSNESFCNVTVTGCLTTGCIIGDPDLAIFADTTTFSGDVVINGTLTVNGTGLTGISGATGATGATGLSGGLLSYGYVYNLAGVTIALEQPVLFDTNGPLLGITHTPGTAGITVTNAGVYVILFSVSGTQSNQFTIFIDGVAAPSTVYGSGAGTQQNTGIAIVTLAAGNTISLVNHTSSAGVGLQTLAGGTQTNVNASVVILQVG